MSMDNAQATTVKQVSHSQCSVVHLTAQTQLVHTDAFTSASVDQASGCE